jgi:anti-anti-sigma factor
MNPVSVIPSPSGKVGVVRLAGDHDIATNVDVRRAVFAAVAHYELTVIDLLECTLIDASTCSLLLAAWKRSDDQHRVVAVNARGVVSRALELTGVGQPLGLTAPATETAPETAPANELNHMRPDHDSTRPQARRSPADA